MVFRLLQNAFASQKMEFRHFYSCPLLSRQKSPAGYHHPTSIPNPTPQAEGNNSSPCRCFFEWLSLQQKGKGEETVRLIWLKLLGFYVCLAVRSFCFTSPYPGLAQPVMIKVRSEIIKGWRYPRSDNLLKTKVSLSDQCCWA